MPLSISHLFEQHSFQFFTENCQTQVPFLQIRRKCIPCGGARHHECSQTDCLCVARQNIQFTSRGRSKVRSGGNDGNRNTAPGQISRSRSTQASEGHDAEFLADSGRVRQASEDDRLFRQLFDWI